MAAENRFKWISLKKVISPSEWQTYEKQNGEENVKDKGYKARMECRIPLEHENSIDAEGYRCRIYEKIFAFEFILSKTTDKEDVDVKMESRYIAMLDENRRPFMKQFVHGITKFTHDKCVTDECISYIWCFDNLLIKMKFGTASCLDFETVISKRFHLEFKNNVSFDGTYHEFANFTDKKFMTLDNFKDQLDCEFCKDTTLVPLEIEITARMFLFPLKYNQHYGKLEPPVNDLSCSLGTNNLQQSMEASSFLPMLSLYSCPTIDVAFKIGKQIVLHPLPYHASLLLGGSPVFKNMFPMPMKKQASGIIEVGDVSCEVLNLFISKIYELCRICDFKLQKIDPLKVDQNIEVLKLAHKYLIEVIVEICSDNLIGLPNDAYSFKSALKILEVGIGHSIDDLQNRSVQWFRSELNTHNRDRILRKLMKLQSSDKHGLISKFLSKTLI